LHALLIDPGSSRPDLELHANVQLRRCPRLRDRLQQALQDHAKFPVVDVVAKKQPAAFGQFRDDVGRDDLDLIACQTNEFRQEVVFRERDMVELRRVGLIVEGPEPIWLWKDGKPELEPVAKEATNHVEVVLVDRETGQLNPRASVDLVFLAGGAEAGRATLTPLLSVFSHYGKTLTLPTGTTSVRIHVHPPGISSLARARLADPADIELPLPARRRKATS